MESNRAILFLVGAAMAVLMSIIVAINCYESVDAGTYHITQSPFSGVVAAQMKPGPYNQFFYTVSTWPVSESYEFTAPDRNGPQDDRIEVTFNDGATAKLSGTVRIELPKSEQEAIELVTKHGFKSFKDLETKLIERSLRNALNMTSNLMSSRDSYSERRADFLRLAKDQIENGVYVTKDEAVKETDPVTGTEVTKIKKIPVMSSDGKAQREPSPFNAFGLRAYGLEIKDWHYEDRVVAQMKAQQEATMAVQTAKAKSLQAEQETKTTKAQGEAAVMKVKYEAEQVKEKETVNAQREALVATISAQKEVDVAKLGAEQARVKGEQMKVVSQLELDAAKLQAQRTLELAEAEAKSRKLILDADGALDKKLAAYTEVNTKWADAYAKQNVPHVVMGSNGAGRDSANTVMDALGVKALSDLALTIKATPAK
jgi:hypothetical protein